MQTVYKKYMTTSAMVWAACFVLLSLVYYFVLSPQKGDLKAKRATLAKSEADFQKATDAFTGATKERLNKQISQTLSKMDSYVAVGEDSSKMVVDVGQIANSVKVVGFSSKGQKDQSSEILPMCKALGADYMHVSFKGSFPQFARFVSELERHKPVIFVDKFTITRSDQIYENDVTMVLSVFVCPMDGSSADFVASLP